MKNPRGSIWKKCDFHVHTPFSALANNFGNDFDVYVKHLFKKAIEKNIHIIGVTDYFSIEGYKKIKSEYLSSETKLQELFTADEILKIRDILLIPNIEFRLNKIIQVSKTNKDGTAKVENGRINFHVLLSDQLPIKLIEESFLHDIDFVYESDPNEKDKLKKLKIDNLTQLGKRLKDEQPDIIGGDLQVGMTHAVVNDEHIINILSSNNDFRDKYLIVVPSDEDLSEIQWKSQDGLTRKIIIARCNALFSSNTKTIAFGLGEKASGIEEFIKEFKSVKPCIWGSDAHDYVKLFEPDKQKNCWIKADASFEGIRQILFEPKDRVFIGDTPELITRIKNARGNYINSISISQNNGYDGKKGIWFKNFELQFGFELIAIIGNKGKGKSALADIIALLGNSHVNRRDYSFLNNDKFCQRGYAENFTGCLKWFDKSQTEKKLNETVDVSSLERVKYIPQTYLEKLCNNEDSGFKEEINKVVFSRLEESDKLGKKSFSELEKFKTEIINQQIDTLLVKINNVNKSIDELEKKSTEDYKKKIENKRELKARDLLLHEKEKETIAVVANPESNPELSVEQRQKAEAVSRIEKEIGVLETSIADTNDKLAKLKIQESDLRNLISEALLQQKNFDEWRVIKAESFLKYGFDINAIISSTIDTSKVQALAEETAISIRKLSESLSVDPAPPDNEDSYVIKLNSLISQKNQIEKDLEKPFKDYQEYVVKIKEWDIKLKSIVGNENTDETIKYYDFELNYLQTSLPTELSNYLENRRSLTNEIYQQKRQIQAIYDMMKEAISDVLKEYSAEQNITIESSFKIDKTFYSQFFDYVNRYGSFYSNGDEELRKFIGKFNFDDIEQLNLFLNELASLDIRFKDNRKIDFYNYICSLSFLHPEYDLRLNNKGLTQLSPGEKGGLLLVFYLVLDKDNKPLIIDQPEDNLDNQSVAEILVPYIKRAKKLRQIIMVTHNPNLAIVSDAEQVIYMDIDKENNYFVSYDSGGIEDFAMNNHIVNILEGKMKAFENRRVKYMKPVSTV